MIVPLLEDASDDLGSWAAGEQTANRSARGDLPSPRGTSSTASKAWRNASADLLQRRIAIGDGCAPVRPILGLHIEVVHQSQRIQSRVDARPAPKAASSSMLAASIRRTCESTLARFSASRNPYLRAPLPVSDRRRGHQVAGGIRPTIRGCGMNIAVSSLSINTQ